MTQQGDSGAVSRSTLSDKLAQIKRQRQANTEQIQQDRQNPVPEQLQDNLDKRNITHAIERTERSVTSRTYWAVLKDVNGELYIIQDEFTRDKVPGAGALYESKTKAVFGLFKPENIVWVQTFSDIVEAQAFYDKKLEQQVQNELTRAKLLGNAIAEALKASSSQSKEAKSTK